MVILVGLLSVVPRGPAGANSGAVLILDASVTNGASSVEAQAAQSLGYAVDVVDGATWDSMTTAQFASYSAIILGDPTCGTSASASVGAAESNASVWGAAVSGNVAIVGTDPVFHAKTQITDGAVAYALGRSGTTGAYISLSCYYWTSGGVSPPVLAGLAGSFTVHGNLSCYDSGHVEQGIATASGSFSGLTDGYLASWDCSVHETFSSWPSSFTPLAIDPSAAPSNFTGSDGVSGQPYMLISGTGSGPGGFFGGPDPLLLSETLGAGNPGEQNSECASGNYPVNCATGNFFHSFTDVSVPGRGPALAATRTYNSLAASVNGPFGYGWSSSYSANLSLDQTTGTVTITQENGATIAFAPGTSGAFAAPPRVLASLVKNPDGTYTLTRHQRDHFTFSASGQLLSQSDLNGYTTNLAYNSQSQLTEVTDPAGRSITLSYGTNGLVSSAADPVGQATTYSYDGVGNLTSVTDPIGRTTSFTYDTNHLLLTMTDPRGGVVTNGYNAQGQVTSQTDPAGRVTTYSYTGTPLGAAGSTTTITDPHHNVETEQYMDGQLVSLTKGVGTSSPSTSTYAYSPFGPTSATDPDGRTTTTVYDQFGSVLSKTDPLGRTTNYSYNRFNELMFIVDPMGITTSYTYDANGNILSKSVGGAPNGAISPAWPSSPIDSSYPLASVACPSSALCVAGDNGGDILFTTDPTAGSWQIQRGVGASVIDAIACASREMCVAGDALGNIMSTTDQTGGSWTRTGLNNGIGINGISCPLTTLCVAVDRSGGVLVSTNPTSGTWTRSDVDGLNALTAISCPTSGLCVAVDRSGNVVSSTNPTGGANAWTVTSGVDAGNQPSAISCSSTTLCVVGDSNGNLMTSTNPTGGTAAWTLLAGLDGTNHITSISCPSSALCVGADGLGSTFYSTNPSGSRGAWSPPSRVDSLVAISGVSCMFGGLCVAVDAHGNALTTGATASATSTFTYGDSGHPGDVTQGSDAAGHITSFTYDAHGDVASVTTHPSAQVTDTSSVIYDALGRKICEASPNAVAAGTSCPPSGSPRQADTTTWAYDADGELASVTDPLGKTTTYSYDADGNRTQSVDPVGNTTTTSYDPNNRVNSQTTGAGSSAASTTTYAYDLAPSTGVCSSSVPTATYCTTTTSSLGATTVEFVDSKNQQIEEVQPAAGTTANNYDAAGNLTTRTTAAGTTTYSYDPDNRVTSILYSSPASGFAATPSVSVAYDADGRPTLMTDGTGTTSYRYDSLGRLVSTTNGAGAWLGYGYDSAGDVAVVEYPNGSKVTRSFDGAGELSALTDWEGHTTTFSYDHNGNLSSEMLPNGVSSSAAFDAADRVVSITDALTSNPSTPLATFSYTRNSDGQVTGESDTGVPSPTGNGYSYDQVQRLASDSKGTYGYDVGSDLVSLPNGTTQAFNSAGQLTSATTASGTTATYSHNAAGDQTTATATSGTTSMTYDEANRLVGFNATAYAYNGDGLRMSKTVPGSQPEQFTWDVSGTQPLALADGTNYYVYGPGGIPLEQLQDPSTPITLVGTSTQEATVATTPVSPASVAVSLPSGVAANDQILIAVTEDAGQSASLAGYTQVGDWSAGSAGAQLQVFRRTATSAETSATVDFAPTLDAHPVAIVVVVYGGVDPNDPVDVTAGTTASLSSTITVPSLVTSGLGQRLVLFQGALNNPTGAGWTPPTGMTEETQVAQSSLVSEGLADKALLTAGQTGSQSSTFKGSAPSLAAVLVALQPMQPTYYLHDQLGSTRVLVGQSGTVEATYTYDAYGQMTGSMGSPSALAANPFGYAGQYTDAESGLVYLRHRYYDPATGQFLSVDALVSVTGQPYAYAAGDPVNNSDPSGLDPCLWGVCLGFHPGAGANAIVNIGRGASFGLSDTIANWISPGASCTVAQNSLDQGIGSAV